jgi:hypothetical protein
MTRGATSRGRLRSDRKARIVRSTMTDTRPRPAISSPLALVLLALGTLTACGTGAGSSAQARLTDFATRYAAAWSSQQPDSLASFYTQNGTLIVNGGAPSVGRAAIRATAAAFMSAFPDMLVVLDSVIGRDNHAVFHWTWTGTNTGPGGTGAAVHLHGYEEWTLSPDGLIIESVGHYDEAEYQRQVSRPG